MADRVICVSGGVCQDIARWTVGLGSRLTIIHNPIRPPPSDMPRRLLRSPRKRIGWVGRLDDPKNPGLLLDAFVLIAHKEEIDVVYVGDGPLRAGLEQRCAELGLQERVSFAKFQPNPYELLATCNLLALTSDREGFPTVLIEAMYCGLGVVSTDCGEGVHEILLGSTYGTIVSRRDPRALAQAILAELARPRDCTAQFLGATRFLPETVAAEFLATLDISGVQRNHLPTTSS